MATILFGCAAAWLAPRAPPPRMAAPDIDWQQGTVVSNDEVGRGSRLLRIKSETSLNYLPGHILGLEIEAGKGPYTVTRATEDTFDVVYRVLPLGRKTPSMAMLAPGAAVGFGGRFGTPIAEGIREGSERVVLLSTGVGVGPMLGYAEAALAEAAGPKLELYAGFRDRADVCCGEELDALLGPRFAWTPCITLPWACTAAMLAPLKAEPEQGRVSRVAPPKIGATDATHFHLVGNGAMVKEVKQGLLDGGVAEEAVTTEVYFNGKAEPDAAVVEFVAEQLRAGARAAAVC